MPRPTKVPGLARTTPLAIAGPLLVRARLADVRRYESKLGGGAGEPDEDAVHDMRVAVRRLRAALESLGDGGLAALAAEAKAIQEPLGAVRDRQVLRRWVRERATRMGKGAHLLAAAVGSPPPEASRDLEQALRGWSGAVAPTILEFSAMKAPAQGSLGGPHVARAVRRRLDRLARKIDRAVEEPSPRAAHRVPIAVKKVRYLAEVARPGPRRAAKELLASLEPLQERLGDLHDADVRARRFEALTSEGSVAGARRRAQGPRGREARAGSSCTRPRGAAPALAGASGRRAAAARVPQARAITPGRRARPLPGSHRREARDGWTAVGRSRVLTQRRGRDPHIALAAPRGRYRSAR